MGQLVYLHGQSALCFQFPQGPRDRSDIHAEKG
jgi:hypothetical protein